MKEFKYKNNKFYNKDIDPKDKGISVKDALKLLHGSDFYDDIYNILGIKNIINDFIEIPGATHLVDSIDTENKRYEKIDINKNFEDLSFSNSIDKSNIHITFTESDKYPTAFVSTPIYSAQNTFLENSCSMSKYANRLIKNDRIDLVLQNLEDIRNLYLEGRETHRYSYRILKDKDGDHYFRAVTSTDRYKDYNISLSIFVALIALHKHIKASNDKFIVNRCEYSESYVRAFFEKVGKRSTKIGEIKYLIELSNSEIREGAVRLSGVFAIVYKVDKLDQSSLNISGLHLNSEGNHENLQEGEERDLLIKPRPNNLRYSIQTINHNEGPNKAIAKMKLSDKIIKNEEKVFKDLESIEKAKSPSMILNTILEKIDRIKNESDLGEFKHVLKKEIPEAINNYHELFRLLNRLDWIASDNSEAKDQLRYLFYEALLSNKGFGTDQEDNIESI